MADKKIPKLLSHWVHFNIINMRGYIRKGSVKVLSSELCRNYLMRCAPLCRIQKKLEPYMQESDLPFIVFITINRNSLK